MKIEAATRLKITAAEDYEAKKAEALTFFKNLPDNPKVDVEYRASKVYTIKITLNNQPSREDHLKIINRGKDFAQKMKLRVRSSSSEQNADRWQQTITIGS